LIGKGENDICDFLCVRSRIGDCDQNKTKLHPFSCQAHSLSKEDNDIGYLCSSQNTAHCHEAARTLQPFRSPCATHRADVDAQLRNAFSSRAPKLRRTKIEQCNSLFQAHNLIITRSYTDRIAQHKLTFRSPKWINSTDCPADFIAYSDSCTYQNIFSISSSKRVTQAISDPDQ
jgi:hypothetical protein